MITCDFCSEPAKHITQFKGKIKFNCFHCMLSGVKRYYGEGLRVIADLKDNEWIACNEN